MAWRSELIENDDELSPSSAPTKESPFEFAIEEDDIFCSCDVANAGRNQIGII
jgi:hypothetical protein